MNIFFTADLHYRHKNIIRYCERPFSTIEEMDEALVKNWNSRVSKKDVVYVLGDFYWTKDVDKINDLINSLNGKIHLIKGNHDTSKVYEANFQSVHELKTIKIKGEKIVLCHYPMRSWDSSFHGSYHLYGHVHGTISNPIANSIDIGVDSWGYFPVLWEEVKGVIDGR